MANTKSYSVDVNNPIEDPFVYYTDEYGRSLKGHIELVKSGFWGRKGKMILFLDSLKTWDGGADELSTTEFVTALKRIIEQLDNNDLSVELR